MDRVLDICHGCRRCYNLCPSFPTLFDFIDAKDGDVSALTDGEHRQVVDECYQCKLCYVKCPYVPPHEWELDFPRLMSRVHAVRQKQLVPVKERLTDQFLGRTDALGRVFGRRGAAGQLGDGHTRLVGPPGHGEDGGTGVPAPAAAVRQAAFHDMVQEAERPRRVLGHEGMRAVFPTCFVEYMEPDIGRAIVEVYEHNGVECALPEGTKCCGAPWLHSGRVDEFTKAASCNVAALAAEVRAGGTSSWRSPPVPTW